MRQRQTQANRVVISSSRNDVVTQITVIVPTANRCVSLKHTLESLINQQFPVPDYEILVIENGTADGTRAVVETLAVQYPTRRILYHFDPTPGLLTGRHHGAMQSRGELLTFVDDDIEADPGWLSAIFETFHDPSVQLVGGRNLPKYEAPPPAWVDAFWWTFPSGGRACGSLSLLDMGEILRDIDANYIWGLNFSIRRQALFDLGGFHPDGMPMPLLHFRGDGETGLTIKAKQRSFRAVYQPRALVQHCIPAQRLTPDYFEKRAYNQGISDSYTAIRRQGGLAPAVKMTNTPETQVQKFFRYARKPVHHGRNWMRRLITKEVPPSLIAEENPEVTRIRQAVSAAYRHGYTFHQNAVRDVPGLLDWVLREDYWDYRLPDIGSVNQKTHYTT